MKYEPPFLAQKKDSDGFWVNVAEFESLDKAKSYAKNRPSVLRVVSGPKRAVVFARQLSLVSQM